MAERLCSVGLDVGTTTTSLVVSELVAENKASSFAVPDMAITERKILYESPIHFTPLLGGELVDGEGLRRIVKEEYEKAGLTRDRVDTGAVIITGETSRKENAATVLSSLAEFAGDLVVATAGPDLESVLAAKGSGAVDKSAKTGKTLLHMDIGGGTANLSLIENGSITATACFNVGGRLVKYDENRRITYVSPVLDSLRECQDPPLQALAVGEVLTENMALALARMLAGVLETAAGLAPETPLYRHFITAPTVPFPVPPGTVCSFSGGVAACIETQGNWQRYGDLGPLLGRAIRESRLCRGEYFLGQQTIRATVIGAGCHATALSGSTVHCEHVPLPLKNLPVARLSPKEQDLPPEALIPLIRSRLAALDTWGVLQLPGWRSPAYSRIAALADCVSAAMEEKPCYIALEADMAKALGTAISLRRPGKPCLCVDRVCPPPGSYLDVVGTVGSAMVLVVKTLIFSEDRL